MMNESDGRLVKPTAQTQNSEENKLFMDKQKNFSATPATDQRAAVV
jgi:hypothetical protein